MFGATAMRVDPGFRNAPSHFISDAPPKAANDTGKVFRKDVPGSITEASPP